MAKKGSNQVSLSADEVADKLAELFKLLAQLGVDAED